MTCLVLYILIVYHEVLKSVTAGRSSGLYRTLFIKENKWIDISGKSVNQ